MDTPNEQPNESNETVGFSTRTDVAGTVGTQPDAADVEASSGSAATEVTQPPQAEPLAEAARSKSDAKPGETLGDNAPKLSALQNQACPNCTVGVLYVTRYDPEATHESDQGTALAAGHESGGAYDIECRNCGFTDSRAFNPGKLWGR